MNLIGGTYKWYSCMDLYEELCDAMIASATNSKLDKNKLYRISNRESNPVLHYMNGEIVRVRPLNSVVIGDYVVEKL